MELAFVLLFVLLGTGAILYAGLRRPAAPDEAPQAPEADSPDADDREESLD